MLILALSVKMQILIISAIVLAIQWPLAILAIYLLFKDKGIKNSIIIWNFFIMFAIIIGPITYFIYRKCKKR